MTRLLNFSGLCIFTFVLALGFTDCRLDDGNDDPNLTASDLSISVQENPALGQELGQVIASAEGAELIFEVISSEPMGAFVAEGASGIIKVADETLFDFESRANMTALVRVHAGDQSRDVNVFVELEDEEADILIFNQFTDNWITSKFSFNGIFAAMNVHECRLDDEMQLSGTGNYTYDGGDELCGNEDDQQMKTGTWTLDEHLQFILFDKGESHEFRANIDFYDEGRLLLSGSWMGIPLSGEYLSD